jgi:hypothetical protein
MAGVEVFRVVTEFLRLWESRNYGGIAQMLPPDFQRVSAGRLPREVRDMYEPYVLEEAEVRELRSEGAAVCIAVVDLTVNGESETVELRWLRVDDAGSPVPVGLDGGAWRLYLWGPPAFILIPPRF